MFLSYYLPTKPLWRQIYTVILPISLQSMLMVADSTVDALMLGQIGQNELASVSLAGHVQFIYGLLMAMCACAFSIFVSQYWGKKDSRTVEKLLGMIFQVGTALAAFFFAVTFFFPRQVMLIFTSEPVFLDLSGVYLRWLAVSYFFLSLTQGLSTVCRCTGFARRMLWISCATVPLDMIFNYIFIFGICGHLRWGVAGAAIATVIVRFIGLVLTYLEFKREGLFRIRLFYLVNVAKSLFRHIVKYTLPIFGNYVCWGAGMITASIVMGHQEPDAVAANSLARIVGNAAAIFFSGMGGGATIILGHLLGGGHMKQAADTGRRLYAFAFLLGLVSSVVLVATTPFVEHFAKLTPRAAELTRWMLLLTVPSMIGRACNGFAFMTFNTGGDSKSSFRIDFITVVCIVVPVSIIAAFVFRANALLLYFIVYMDEFVKAPVALAHYLKFTWLKDLTKRSA